MMMKMMWTNHLITNHRNLAHSERFIGRNTSTTVSMIWKPLSTNHAEKWVSAFIKIPFTNESVMEYY